MDHKNLIECVKQFDFLYNQEDKRYSNNEKKEAAWKEIGKMLNKPGLDCKKHWNNLKDLFRRAIKKRKDTQSGQAATQIKKWKFEDKMSFLLPHIKERGDNITSVNVDLEKDSDSYDEEGSNSLLSQEKNNCQPPTPQKPNEEQSSSMRKQTSVSSKQTGYLKRKINQPETASSTLMRYILQNKKENVDPEANITNDIDLFFKSISATVKKLSPYNQALAKARVFSIVSQLEMEELSCRGLQPISSVPRPVSTLSSYSDDSTMQPPPSQLQHINTNNYNNDTIPNDTNNYNTRQFYGDFSSELNNDIS